MVELLALCKRKLTLNLEGGLISCLALLNHITAYLSDSTVMDVLHVISIILLIYVYHLVYLCINYTGKSPTVLQSSEEKKEKTLYKHRSGNIVSKL